MNGWEIALMVLGIFACGTMGYLFELWFNKKEREFRRENDEEFLNLITEFDEMDYTPTTLCEDSEKTREKFKLRLIKVFFRKR